MLVASILIQFENLKKCGREVCAMLLRPLIVPHNVTGGSLAGHCFIMPAL